MDIAAVADDLEQRLTAVARPERAEQERRYLKSNLIHLGVSVPATRKVTTEVFRSCGGVGHDDLVALAIALWETPIHESRLAAVELLALGSDRFSAADAPVLERLLRESRTWALLDGLATSVIGTLVDREPPAWDAILRRWAVDDDFWVRRASLLAHLPGLRRGAGDFERFGELADPMLVESEFFIRKAIGWVLREAGKARPDLVADWLGPRTDRAAGLTVREAVKRLPNDLRARVLAAANDSRH